MLGKGISAVLISVFCLLALCTAQNGYTGPWRSSLDSPTSCWAQPTTECNRAMVIVHGGDWDLNQGIPYDSSGAFQRGYENGADMVKGDFRVNKENVGMIMHSSPIEYWESLECRGKKVEQMTTAQCEACPMISADLSHYNFTSSPEMLAWSADKVNFMFCVKAHTDIPRAISSLLEYSAQHRAALEIKNGDLQAMFNSNPRPEGWDSVYYIAELDSHDDAVSLLAQSQDLLDRAILVEFTNWDTAWTPEQLQSDLAAFKARGCRTMTATNSNPPLATEDDHRKIWGAGFDVVYTYNLANAVVVRQEVNAARGISPP
jgi:hypothetical protein